MLGGTIGERVLEVVSNSITSPIGFSYLSKTPLWLQSMALRHGDMGLITF